MSVFQPEGIKPLALLNEFLHFEGKYYQVQAIETLPPFVKDFGSFTSEQEKAKQKVEEVHQPENYLAQLRFYPLDDLGVKVWQPAGVGKHLTQKAKLHIEVEKLLLDKFDPCLHLTEFYQWEDREILFTVKNKSRYDIPMGRVVFFGIKYKLKEVPKPPKFTAVFTKGLGE